MATTLLSEVDRPLAGGGMPLPDVFDPLLSPPSGDLLASLAIAPPRGSERALRDARARAKRLLALEFDFIGDADFAGAKEDAPAFDAASGERFGLATTSEDAAATSLANRLDSSRPASNSRRLTAEEEASLFRRMNYLKYRANVARTRLDPEHPCEQRMCEIERCLAESGTIRNEIVCTFVPLVGAIARRFLTPELSYEEMVSEGCVPLLAAIAKFDFRRGFRFSTYATHAVQRHFYRWLSKRSRDRSRYLQTAVEMLDAADDPRRKPSPSERRMLNAAATMERMIERLDRREQLIIRSRFGLERGQKGQTLQAIAERLGVCRERVRQLEQRALRKLREMVPDAGLEAPFS